MSTIPEWPGADFVGAGNAVPSAAQTFGGWLAKEILNPILAVIFALALGYFLWGLMVFMVNAAGSGKQEEGRSHMLWGVIGMTIMVGAFALIQLALSTFGISKPVEGIPVGIVEVSLRNA